MVCNHGRERAEVTVLVVREEVGLRVRVRDADGPGSLAWGISVAVADQCRTVCVCLGKQTGSKITITTALRCAPRISLAARGKRTLAPANTVGHDGMERFLVGGATFSIGVVLEH